MQTKIIASLLGMISLICLANPALASQVPAGYVLVPADVFFGQGSSVIAPNTTVAEVSTSKSSVRVNDEIGYVGEKYSVATVTLRDEANRPVAGESVTLISSRATDSIKALQNETNSNGEASFQVLAKGEGVSSLTALAGNQTILERPRIVFLQKAGGIGGNLLRADVVTASAPTKKTVAATLTTNQVFADFPNTIKADTPTDITVTIKDADGKIVEDFRGTINFQSSDSLAILPKEYTFGELDRGSHNFANAVTMLTAGDQTITIAGDTNLGSQEVPVKVLDGVGGVATPVITSPTDGALLNKTVLLEGLAPVNSNLVVFTDGQFLKNGQSDGDGKFLIDADLVDGQHEITVGVLKNDSSVGAVSEAIRVNLDKTKPVLEDVSLDPGNRVVSGQLVKITVKSESALAGAQFRIENESDDLIESSVAGTYTGEFTAPADGAYFVSVELTDKAGNIGSFPEATSILVEVPITIEKVETTPRDGRVDLRWDAPANTASIAHYEIFYGTDKEQLDKKFTTTDNRTAWFIDNLNNNTKYFFRVVSVDADSKQNGGSEIVQATPTAMVAATGCDSKIILSWQTPTNSKIANYRLDYGVASGDYAESRLLSGGKKLKQWEVRDLVNGSPYFFALRGVDDFGEVVADMGEVSATPTAGEVCGSIEPIQLFQKRDAAGNIFLVWNPVAGATSYRIYAGTQPNVFDLPTVEVAANAFQPKGLAKNTDYYFAVSAVFSGVHNAATLSNVTKVEVGPAEIIFISLIAAFVGSLLIRRKFSRS
ncbi:MAG: fibronectin type III domain-containing protein [Patescibacteria group bacterium]